MGEDPGRLGKWVVTATNFYDYMLCPKLYYWRQVKGYQWKMMPGYIGLGTLVHSGLEERALNGMESAIRMITDKLEAAFAGTEDEADYSSSFSGDKLAIHETTAKAMVRNTPESWLMNDLLTVEEEFYVPWDTSMGEIVLAGKVDGTLRREGRLVIRDYKTMGDFGKYQDPLILERNWQANFYRYMLPAFDYEKYGEIEGMEFLLIRRPTIRQRQKETVMQYMKRVELDYASPKRVDHYYGDVIAFPTGGEDKFRTTLNQWLEDMSNAITTGEFRQSHPQCSPFAGRRCPYLKLCLGHKGAEEDFHCKGANCHPELHDLTKADSAISRKEANDDAGRE